LSLVRACRRLHDRYAAATGFEEDSAAFIPSAHLPSVKNTAFCFNRGVIDELLKIAHDECSRLRQTGDPDAAILVIGRRGAGELNSLVKIKERIATLFNETALTVESSDGPQARDQIRAFKNGSGRWIVAKEMISEGTNLPRLRIVVILRDIGNRTFYEQLVHRVTRNDADDCPQDAIIIQIKLPQLHEWGSNLENQALIGREKQQRNEEENVGGGAQWDGDKPLIEGICAELEDETVMIEGEDCTDVDPLGRRLHALVGLNTKTSRWQIDMMLKQLPNVGIDLNKATDSAQDELFSVDQQFNRRYERALQSIRAAAFNLGGGDAYKRVTAECKRAAGLVKYKLTDVIREHPKPLDAMKRFEQAAQQVLQRSKQQQQQGSFL
jgi:hypothetical protein